MQAKRRAPASLAAALASAALALALTATAGAATREPLSRAYAALHDPGAALAAADRPDPRALAAARRDRRLHRLGSAGQARIVSTHYQGAALDSVAAVLSGLAHGPELAQLTVYVATPGELTRICGPDVLACYLPGEMQMVVSGLDRRIAGVPRDFAIAHEYGHHIANTRQGALAGSSGLGTVRWATYERVCQFVRSGWLFPGNRAGHYWQDPEEAFAESYAHLNRPQDRVPWPYAPLLAPTYASLAKLRADVVHPWSGPVRRALRGLVAGAGSAVSWSLRTPLDGDVSVTVQAPPGADLDVFLRPAEGGRALARARTGPGGSADLSYASCGRDGLELEVRSRRGSGVLEATVLRP